MKQKLISTASSVLLLCLIAGRASALSFDEPKTVSYLDAAGNQRIYVFAVGTNHHLVVNWWDGSDWNWDDLGLPDSTTYVQGLTAITYRDADGNQRIYVFARNNHSHLVVDWWDGSAWNWADQGLPPGASGVEYPAAAITYLDASGHQRIYVFAVTINSGHLVANWWDGSAWNWADQGLPPGALSVHRPAAITYVDPDDRDQRIYVFALGDNHHLIVNWWDGGSWHWTDQGLPFGTTEVAHLAPITYLDADGNQRIYVFAEGSNFHLVVNWFDGVRWQWADQGLAPGTTYVAEPNAVSYLDASGIQRIYVFASGSNFHLVVNYWDGSAWNWADQGLPLGSTGVFLPHAITYSDATGGQRIYVFALRAPRGLAVNYWDGFNWNWADQGSPY